MWIGALNWGLVGVGELFGSNWNVVDLLLGGVPTIESIVYILVGLSALYACSGCKDCKKGCDACEAGACSVHGK
jgi:uncharacterized membrane protein YuzA (DUF378 family)